jgi:ribonuclease HI
MEYILHTDGGSRGNPGPSGIGFAITGEGGQELAAGGAYIGTMTNNQAEYRALIWGLENAYALGIAELSVVADSELMVKQLNGQYKVKNAGIKPLWSRAQALRGQFSRTTFTHTLRAGNKRADALVNQALDTRAECGEHPVGYTEA